MTVILFLFLTLSAFAQEFQHRLEGSFTSNATTINYTINWNETSTTLQGLYQDNLFAQGPTTMTGTVGTTGRTFSVILPTETLGVRQLVFQSPVVTTTSGSIPLNITTRDSIGRVVDAPNTMAMMSTMQAATAPGVGNDDSCVIGFGALTGYCGMYNGAMNEISDNRERCNLLSLGNPKLELAADTVFRLYLADQQLHNIGPFLPSPQSNTINVTSRNCTVMPGTTFVPNNCKTVNLNGIFFNQAGTITFNGTYSISDEVNADACSYTMNLTREVTY